MDPDPVGFGGCGAVRSLGFRESRKVKEFRMEPDIAGLELGVVENVVDHLAHPVRFLDDEVEIFISGVLVFPVDVADELRISGDHGERGADMKFVSRIRFKSISDPWDFFIPKGPADGSSLQMYGSKNTCSVQDIPHHGTFAPHLQQLLDRMTGSERPGMQLRIISIKK